MFLFSIISMWQELFFNYNQFIINWKGGYRISKITINYDVCEGVDCEECVDVCPMEILVLDGDKIKIQNIDDCNECEACMDVCPNECITVE